MSSMRIGGATTENKAKFIVVVTLSSMQSMLAYNTLKNGLIPEVGAVGGLSLALPSHPIHLIYSAVKPSMHISAI